MTITEGTAEWFRLARRDASGDFRLFQDFTIALNNLKRIVDCWDQTDELVRAALHSSAVVAYARPFKESFDRDGKAFRYPVKRIARSAGFDLDLHKHLLEVRDGMVAHSDADLADRVIHIAAVNIETEKAASRALVQAGVQGTAIFGFGNVEFARECLAHVGSGLTAAHGLLSSGLQAYLRVARTHPDIATADVDGRQRQMQTPSFNIPGGETVQAQLPSALAMTKAPAFKTPRDGSYNYLIIEHTERAGGKIVLRAEDGSEQAIDCNWSQQKDSDPSPPVKAP